MTGMTDPGNRTILVVEDDEGLRKLIIRTLSKAGYAAEGASDGAEALSRIPADRQVVLLLDQKLPDMSGSDIILALKARGLHVPFILMTGRGDERFAVEMMKLGAADYLVKGIDFIDLLPGALQRLFRELDAERRVEAAEKALRENEAKQRAMVANISDVIAIIDREGINRYKSPNVQKWFGWRAEDLVGVSTFDNVHPEDRDRIRIFFAALLEAPESTGTSECRYRCSDGSYKWIEFTAVNLLPEPEIQGVLLNYHDISERKRTDDQLRRSLEEKEVLLREVQHRVKNNLNVITSLLDLQASVIRTPDQAIEAFRNSGDRVMAMALVHEELYKSGDYARVDMGDYLDKLTGQLVQSHDAARQVRIRSRANGIILGVDTAVPCGLILTELITNALRHAFPGGRSGSIDILFDATDHTDLALSIADDGVGLPADIKAREGETLGLTLVRLLVEQLKGSMAFSSEGGTRCEIRFARKAGT